MIFCQFLDLRINPCTFDLLVLRSDLLEPHSPQPLGLNSHWCFLNFLNMTMLPLLSVLICANASESKEPGGGAMPQGYECKAVTCCAGSCQTLKLDLNIIWSDHLKLSYVLMPLGSWTACAWHRQLWHGGWPQSRWKWQTATATARHGWWWQCAAHHGSSSWPKW